MAEVGCGPAHCDLRTVLHWYYYLLSTHWVYLHNTAYLHNTYLHPALQRLNISYLTAPRLGRVSGPM